MKLYASSDHVGAFSSTSWRSPRDDRKDKHLSWYAYKVGYIRGAVPRRITSTKQQPRKLYPLLAMSKLFGSLLVATLAVAVIASPVAEPAITEAPSLAKRATSCTFSGSSGAASASKSQSSCSTIILSSVAVPSGTTLDLSSLPDDTTVSIFCSLFSSY